MTDLEFAFVQSLHQQGYAVLVLAPRELEGLQPHVVERHLAAAAVQVVAQLLNPEDPE